MNPTTTYIAIYLRAGTVYDFEIPADENNKYGHSPKQGVNKDGVALQNGFWIENDEVGRIVAADPDKVKISYYHELPYENIIWFESQLGHKVRYSLTNVPVHDHATITTGGPAYGTYYSELQPQGDT